MATTDLVLRETRCRVLKYRGDAYVRADDLVLWCARSAADNADETVKHLLRMLGEEIERVTV